MDQDQSKPQFEQLCSELEQEMHKLTRLLGEHVDRPSVEQDSN